MKKIKKHLSLFLAMVMALSVCTVGFTAFAKDADVESIEKSITSLQKPMDVTVDLIKEYRELTVEKKNSIEPPLLYKIYNYTLNYFAETTGSAASSCKSMVTNKATGLGAFTPNMTAAMKLGLALGGFGMLTSPVDADGNKQPTFIPYNMDLSTEKGMKELELCKIAWKNASPWTQAIANFQKYVSASFFGDLPLRAGVDEAFLLFEYLLFAKDASVTTEQKLNYFLNDVKVSKEEKDYLKSVSVVANDYNSFVEGGMTVDAFYSKYKAFSEASITNSATVSFDERITIFSLSSATTSQFYAPSQVITMMVTKVAETKIVVDKIDKMNAFCDKVTAVDLSKGQSSELNAIIASLKTEASKLDVGYDLAKIRQDNPTVFQKYTQILNMVCDDLTVKGESLHKGFEQEFVDYQMGKPYGAIITDTLIPSLDTILAKLLPAIAGGNTLRTVVEKAVFTNANAGALIILLAGIVEGNTPETIAANFEGYGKTEIANNLKKYATFADIPADFDWGVERGDYRSFFETITIGSILIVLGYLMPNVLKFDNTTNELTQVTPMMYERVVVPLMEAIGAENVMSSMEFTLKMQELAGNDSKPELEAWMDSAMLLFDEVYLKVIVPILENPVDFLSKNLPNFIYHLEDGCVFDAVKELLKELGSMLGDMSAIEKYLSIEGIFEALAPVLESAGIKIDSADILKFARLGKANEVPTVKNNFKTTIRVEGDRQSVVGQLAKILEPIALNLLGGLGVDFKPKGEFVKLETPAYPHNGKMDKKVMATMIAGIDGLIGGLVNINDLINKGLCTNAMAGTIIKGLYGALDSIDIGSLGLGIELSFPSPNDIAAMLPEKKFAALAEELNMKSNDWADIAFTIMNGNEVINQVDMGFKDGDRDGFVATIVASLRPLIKLLNDANLIINSTVAGKQAYGLYETLIIPVFEAIGLTPAATSAVYTSNFIQLMKKVPTLADDATKEQKKAALEKSVVAYDYLANTILSPVLGLLKELAAAPLDTLLRVLPNLAYAIQHNPTLAFVGNLLSKGTGTIDLAGMLNGLIGSLLPGFELPKLDLNSIASCGKLTEIASKSATDKTVKVIIANKEDAFVTVFYYLYDAINYKDNLKAIKALIGDIQGMDPTLSGLADSLLNQVFTASKEESLCLLGTILAADVWECPDPKEGGAGAGTGTGTGSKTPGTGDSVTIATGAFLVMLTTAGIAIVLLRKKQKIS